MEGLQITVQNYSEYAWDRSDWTAGAGTSQEPGWTDEVTQTPLDALPRLNGMATAAARSVRLTWLCKTALFLRLGYKSAQGRFVVEVRQPFQLLSIPRQTEWVYLDGHKWSDSTSHSDAHRWEFEKVQVVATPTLSSDGGSIAVLITEKPKV